MDTKRKSVALLGFAALCQLAGMLSGCSQVPKSISELPELPSEMAKDLVEARTAPVLMTGRIDASTNPPTTPPPVALAPPRACTTSYDGYVTFPMTVCHVPPLHDLEIASKSPNGNDGGTGQAAIGDARFFKLTSHAKLKIRHPFFCSVSNGPWYAHVEGKQLCNVDPNFRQFTAQILGAPEPVAVIWSGALSNVPPPLVLTAISETGVACTCCSGVMCPNGDCKPKFDMCGIMPPAIK